MVRKLKSYEINLNLHNKENNDIKATEDKLLNVIHDITEIFYKYNLDLEEAQLSLEAILHGVMRCRMDDFIDIKELI